MRLTVYLLIGFFLSCQAENPLPTIQTGHIPELFSLSQDPQAYLEKTSFQLQSDQDRKRLTQSFLAAYFRIWTQDDLERPDLYTDQRSFHKSLEKCYAENFQPWGHSYLETEKAVSFSPKNLNLNAITLANTNLNMFPSEMPCFNKPLDAGEGFPFNYNQEDYVYIGTPLKIIDFSSDKLWALVWSNAHCYGWIKTKDLMVLSDKEAKDYMSRSFGVVIKDRAPVQTPSGFSDSLFLGTILPLNKKGLFIPRRSEKGNLVFDKINNEAHLAHPLPLPWTKENVRMILDQLNDKVYGWGSLNGNRDCSALLKSYFAAFGHHLPRNSTSQALKALHQKNLEDIPPQEKRTLLTEHGIPFQTAVRLKGHVMLYVGTLPDYGPIYFHATWGLKTKKDSKEGRFVIGRSVFTSGNISRGLEKASVVPKNYTEDLTHLMFYPLTSVEMSQPDQSPVKK